MAHTPEGKENKKENFSINRMKRISFGTALIYKHTPSPSELEKPKPKGQRHVEERTINFNESLTQSETPTKDDDIKGSAQAAASAVWPREKGNLPGTEFSGNSVEEGAVKTSRGRQGTPRPSKTVEKNSKSEKKCGISDILHTHAGNDGIWGFARNNLSRESSQSRSQSASRSQTLEMPPEISHNSEKAKGAVWDFDGGLSNATDNRGKQALDNLLQSDERSTGSFHDQCKPPLVRKRSTSVMSRHTPSFRRRSRQKSLPVLSRSSLKKRRIPMRDRSKSLDSPTFSRTPGGKSMRTSSSSVGSRYGEHDRKTLRSSSKQSIGSFFSANDNDIDVTRHADDSHFPGPDRSASRTDISEQDMELEIPPDLENVPKIRCPESDEMDIEEENVPANPFQSSGILPKPRKSTGISLEGVLKDRLRKQVKLSERRKKRQSMPNLCNKQQMLRRRFSMPAKGQQQDSSELSESQFMLQEDRYTMSKSVYSCEFPSPVEEKHSHESEPDLQAVGRPKRKSMQTVEGSALDKEVGQSYSLVQKAAEKWAETSFKEQYLNSSMTPDTSSADNSYTIDLPEQRQQFGVWRHKSGRTSNQIIDELMGGPMVAPRLSTQPVEQPVLENTEMIKWNALIGHKYNETEKMFSEGKRKKIERFINETKRLQEDAKSNPSPLVLRYADADENGKRKIRKQINTHNQICALEADIEGKQLLVKERCEKIAALKDRANELLEKMSSKKRLLDEIESRIKSIGVQKAHAENSYLAKRARRIMMEKAEQIERLQQQLKDIEVKNTEKDLRLQKAKDAVLQTEDNLAKFRACKEKKWKEKEEREKISNSIKRYYELTGLHVSFEDRKLVVLALWRFRHTFIFNEDDSIADSFFEVLRDDLQNPTLPPSERSYIELLEQVVPLKAHLLGGPNVTSKNDINLSQWSLHVCRCLSLVKELVELRDREPYCLDARVELTPESAVGKTHDTTISIHLAKKGKSLNEFRDFPVAVIWLSLQGLENYPLVTVSKCFAHVAWMGNGGSNASVQRMDLEKVILSELRRVQPGIAYVLRLYRAAWNILEENCKLLEKADSQPEVIGVKC